MSRQLLGYKKGSPYLGDKSITINSNLLTTEDMAFPILAVPNKGTPKVLFPNTGQHQFEGSKVKEYPMQDINELKKHLQSLSSKKQDLFVKEYEKMEKGGIHINPKNKGKFTETMRKTGKSAEELSHSKNPLTRKRAVFALNARKWKHQEGGEIPEMKEGGIPQRYKNMGFTRVGQKKEGDGQHKWKVLAKKGDKYKVVQGGYRGMKDFSQHRSEKRRKNFWNRMGGKNSAKANDKFSPLYWHKRLGKW